MLKREKFQKMNDKSKWVIVSSLGILVDVLRFKNLQLRKENTTLKKRLVEVDDTNEKNKES
jgi:hypothetical protein